MVDETYWVNKLKSLYLVAKVTVNNITGGFVFVMFAEFYVM
jgi:hypothetical protein